MVKFEPARSAEPPRSSGSSGPKAFSAFCDALRDAMFCGLAVRFALGYAKQTWAMTYHHTMSYALLPVVTMIITVLIAGNIALSLGMIGALSIVRFRAAIKEPEELVYLFFIIGIGLANGANQFLVSIICTFCTGTFD